MIDDLDWCFFYLLPRADISFDSNLNQECSRIIQRNSNIMLTVNFFLFLDGESIFENEQFVREHSIYTLFLSLSRLIMTEGVISVRENKQQFFAHCSRKKFWNDQWDDESQNSLSITWSSLITIASLSTIEISFEFRPETMCFTNKFSSFWMIIVW